MKQNKYIKKNPEIICDISISSDNLELFLNQLGFINGGIMRNSKIVDVEFRFNQINLGFGRMVRFD